MRLAKKLGAVVAMATVCLTTVAPTMASAATCPPHAFTTVREYDSHTEHHAYLYGVVDGEELIWRDCVITTTKITENLKCNNCNLIIPDEDPEEITTHSACGL